MDALDLIRDFFGGFSGCDKCRKVWGKYKPTFLNWRNPPIYGITAHIHHWQRFLLMQKKHL